MTRLSSLSAALVAGLVAGVLSAAPAQADEAEPGYSLDLSGPTRGSVGRPMLLTARGTESHVHLNMYIDAYAIPASLVSTCPGSGYGALQLAEAGSAQGGEKFAYVVPAEGSFSVPIAYTPRRSGRFVLCAYLTDLGWDGAWAQHDVRVGAVGAGARPPRNITKPRLTRQGRKLVCQRGTWANRPRSYAFRWQVGGKRRAGATRATLKVTRQLRGKKVRCVVVARNAAGSASAGSNTLRVR